MLYNNQWYYGNQSNEPALVSTSKEINLVQATATTTTGTFTATNTSPFAINFSSRPDYYTFPIQYWNFTNFSTSTITSYTSNFDKRLGINIGGGSSNYTLVMFKSSSDISHMTRRLLIMPTNLSYKDYKYVLYAVNSNAENYSSTQSFTDIKTEEIDTSAPSAFTPVISNTSVTCKSISIMWYGAKFEY